jgi:hypothetical protein
VQDRAFAGTGKSCEDDEVPGVVSRGPLHGYRAQLFSRRWCVLGMRMSSRYFATVRRVT